MSKSDSKNIKKSEAPMPTSITETTSKSDVKLDLKSAKEEVLAEKGIEITKPLEAPVKEVKIVKPSINKVPKVVKILEKNEESVVSAYVASQEEETATKTASSSPVVSFARKSTGTNTSGIVPSDLSAKVSAFENYVLRIGLKSRGDAESLSKAMLGDSVQILTGKNPLEVYFEYEGVRVPASGIFPIR